MKDNRTSVKRSLFVSAIALTLTAALLIGTTFAWFTSTATTSVSSVMAGTLKVEIVNLDGSELEDNTVKFVDKTGSSNILWEPGVTFTTKEFKIKNAGNLALKYKFQLGMNVTDENKALYNAITFYIAYKDANGTEQRVDVSQYEGH